MPDKDKELCDVCLSVMITQGDATIFRFADADKRGNDIDGIACKACAALPTGIQISEYRKARKPKRYCR